MFAAESPDINGISLLPVVGNQKIHAAVNKIPIPVFQSNSVIVIHETKPSPVTPSPQTQKGETVTLPLPGFSIRKKRPILHVVFLYNYAKPFELNFGIFFGEKIFLHTIKIKML